MHALILAPRRNYALNKLITFTLPRIYSCPMSKYCKHIAGAIGYIIALVQSYNIMVKITFSFVNVVRWHNSYGLHHALGDCLEVCPKTGNNYNKYTVSAVKHGRIINYLATSSAIADLVALVMCMCSITGVLVMLNDVLNNDVRLTIGFYDNTASICNAK